MEIIGSLSFLAWPAAAVIAVLIIALIFVRPISRLIDRANRVDIGKLGSLDASPGKQIEAQTETSSPIPLPAPAASGAPAWPPPTVSLARAEGELRKSLEESFANNIELQLAWAIRTAAIAQVERNFEAIYRVIFGSQIAALKEMNVRSGLSVRDARAFYQRAATQFPDVYSGFTFEQWAGFALSHELVIVPEPKGTDDDRAVLTQSGKDFLHFLVGRSLSENKPF